MPNHFSNAEVLQMDKLLKAKNTPGDIIRKLQSARARAGKEGPSASAVYRFLKGETFKRDVSETRGAKARLPTGVITVANQQRRRLIKKANNNYLVTWEDVHKATKETLRGRSALRGGVRMPSPDWLARKVREKTPVRARPGKRRIDRSKAHEEMRSEQGQRWSKYAKSFWVNNIHAYIDNKVFVVARTPHEKQRVRARKIHHHLRTPSEGGEPGFVLPKKDRVLLGIPSVNITAAVAKGKIFFWYVNTSWNGEAAKEMYHELGKALRARYGNKRIFRVVEDGDTKGYQSGKGKQAKTEERIESWELPPRSPGWMPLDFCLWDDIEDRMLANSNKKETQDEYVARLRRTALFTSASVIDNCLGKIKANIDETVASGGKNTKSVE